MNKKDFVVILLKTAAYAIGLLLVGLGVNSLTSCNVSKHSFASGKTTVVTVDTTYVYHTLSVTYPKSK